MNRIFVLRKAFNIYMNLIKIQEVHIFYDSSLSLTLNKFHMLKHVYLVYKHKPIEEFKNFSNIAMLTSNNNTTSLKLTKLFIMIKNYYL